MRALALCLSLALLLLAAGCTQFPGGDTFNVDGEGRLALALAPDVRANATVLNATSTRVVFTADDGVPVTAYLAAPPHPKAAVVYVPGRERARLGPRGALCDATPTPASPSSTLTSAATASRRLATRSTSTPTTFGSGRTGGRSVPGRGRHHAGAGELRDDVGVPVWAVGSSNGGRYAAIAAGIDPPFAGYAGVSTSGFGTAPPGARPSSGSRPRSTRPRTLARSARARSGLPRRGGQGHPVRRRAGALRSREGAEGVRGVQRLARDRPGGRRRAVGRLTQIYGP